VKKRRTRLLILGSSALLLAGCASYSGIAPEVVKLDGPALLGKGEAYSGWPQQDWWSELQDPALSELITQALNDNPSLQAAAARLRRASAIAGQTESNLWPQLGASSSSTRERFSENGLIPPPYAGTTQNVNDLQLTGQWEVDFFGKNREALRAALGEVRASEAEHQAARQFLAGNVARGYYNLARLLAQRELAEVRQQQRLALAQLVERRFKAGIDTRVELESAKGVVPENARDIAAVEEQISLARHALAAMIGKQPDAADALSPRLPAVAPLALPKSLPADLLGHRADVVAARWRVEAAAHGLESARASFYPNVNLNAFAGFSAIGFNQWLDSGSRQPGVGLAITLPIFDAGRLRSLYRVSAASVDASVASYNTTLLEALRDIADQLSTLQSLDTQFQQQQASQASAQRSYDLALQRYRADISDRLNVLNAESSLIAQRRASIDLQARWIDGRVRLITALGGGFAETAPPTQAGGITDKNKQN